MELDLINDLKKSKPNNMKAIKCIFIGIIFVLKLSDISGQASSGLKYQKQPTKEPSVVSTKIWYGGGLNLGFSGQSGLNVLQLGASPMVGYKILPRWSVGPRVSFLARGIQDVLLLTK